MSQSVIGALRANLGLDSARFESGARRARGTANTLRRDIARIGAAVAAIGTGLAVAIRGQISAMDDIGKAADRIGVPVEALSRLQHAANLSAVSSSNLEASLQRLAREMVENESKFTDLGIAVRDADGNMRPIEAVLGDVADRLRSMPEGAERTALAYDLMGRQGAALIPMLQGGAAGLRAMTDEAERLGLTVTRDAYEATAQFNDNLTRLAATMTGMFRVITGQLAPALAAFTDGLVSAFNGFLALPEWMQNATIAIVGVTAVLGPLAGGLALVATALGGLLGPVTLAVAGLAALAGLWAAWRSQTEPVPDRMQAVADAQERLNTAMGNYAESAAPAAGGEALNYARDLEQQALAALAAAEAELALAEAEQQRRLNDAPEWINRAVSDGALNIPEVSEARAEIDRLRATLDGARQTINALSRDTTVYGEANRQLAERTATVTVETGDLAETLSDVVDQVTRAGGAIPDLTDGLQQAGDAAQDTDNRLQRTAETLGGLFVAATRGADAFRSALGSLLSRLAETLANRAFMALLGGGGLGGSGGGGLLGGLIGLLLPTGGAGAGLASMAGDLSARAVTMNDIGPSAAIMGPSRALDTADAMTVNINVSGARGNTEIMTMVEQGVKAGLGAYDRALPQRVKSIQSRPRMA